MNIKVVYESQTTLEAILTQIIQNWLESENNTCT